MAKNELRLSKRNGSLTATQENQEEKNLPSKMKKHEMRFESKMPVSTAWLRHWVLPWQFVHLLGSAGWNVAGVVLISHGQRPIGPTASVSVAEVLLLLGVGLWIGSGRWRPLYVAISTLLGVGALIAVVQALVGEASLWPSAFWRWAGACLNLVGFVANFVGVAIALFRRDALRANSQQDR